MRKIQMLISDELAEILLEEGALNKKIRKPKPLARMILYTEQMREKLELRKFSDQNYRVDDL